MKRFSGISRERKGRKSLVSSWISFDDVLLGETSFLNEMSLGHLRELVRSYPAFFVLSSFGRFVDHLKLRLDDGRPKIAELSLSARVRERGLPSTFL